MRIQSSFLTVVTVLLLTAPAGATGNQDDALNGVYASIAAAREQHDVPGMARHFQGEGLLIDSRPGPAVTGAELAQRLSPMADHLRSDKVTVTTAYRIERRSILGDTAVDVGYMRQTMTRPTGQASTRYARFLVTMRRGDDGTWRIIGDASMPAEEAAFAAVAKQGRLQHDA